MPPLPPIDLDHVLAHTPGIWDELRGGRIFITGGTGFFGAWLLETFAWANDRLNLGARAVVLTRDADAFARKLPHLANHPAISFHAGDVVRFDFPPGEFSHVIHAATESATTLGRDDPGRMLDVVLRGTERVLQFARGAKTRKLLLTSSGAIYGRQPADLSQVPENYPGAPDPCDSASVYGEGKRAAELLCSIASRRDGIECKIARCFAFIGPHLPLDAHFAAGNFLRDALAGGPIRVNGDGTPLRSYLYAADLAIWLWTILMRGKATRPYNVGSGDAVSIAQLARTIAAAFEPAPTVQIASPPNPGRAAQPYVPSVQRAADDLSLRTWIDLPEAIRRTVEWEMLKAAGT